MKNTESDFLVAYYATQEVATSPEEVAIANVDTIQPSAAFLLLLVLLVGMAAYHSQKMNQKPCRQKSSRSDFCSREDRLRLVLRRKRWWHQPFKAIISWWHKVSAAW